MHLAEVYCHGLGNCTLVNRSDRADKGLPSAPSPRHVVVSVGYQALVRYPRPRLVAGSLIRHPSLIRANSYWPNMSLS